MQVCLRGLWGKTFTTNVVVGLKEQIIDDYEGNEVAYHINSPYIYPNRPDYRGGDGTNMVGTDIRSRHGEKWKEKSVLDL